MPDSKIFPDGMTEAVSTDLTANDEIMIDVAGTKYIKVSELKKWMSLLETVSYSGAKTLALTDAGTKQVSTGGSDHNVTIPTNATVAFPVGTVIIFRNEGTGFITVAPAVGVTLSGASTTFDAQYQEGYIHKVGTDSWQIVIGGVSAGGGGGDVTAPSLVSATVEDADPDEIVLTYDEALNASIVPATSDYTPSGGRTVTNVAIVGAVVTLTVNTPYANGDTIDIDYAGTASLNPLQDAAGNEAADLTNEPVDNNIASGGGTPVFDATPWVHRWDVAVSTVDVTGAEVNWVEELEQAPGAHPSGPDLKDAGADPIPDLVASVINGYDVVRHADTDILTSLYDSSLSRPLTRLAVIKTPATLDGTTRYILGPSGGFQSDFGIHSSGKFFIYGGGSILQGTINVAAATVYVIIATFDGAGNHSLWVNGVEDITGDSGSHAAISGCVVGASSNGFVGDWTLIADIDSILSDTDIADITTELMTKYGA